MISEGDKLYKKQKYKKALAKYKESKNECLKLLLVIIPDPKYTYDIDDYMNEINGKIEDCLSPPMKYSVKTSSSSSSLSFSKLPLLRKSTPNSRSSNNSSSSSLYNSEENIEMNINNSIELNTSINNNENSDNNNSDTYILPSLTTVSGVFYNGKKLIRKGNFLESKCRFHDASICLKESVNVLKPLIIRELKDHEKDPLCFYISESELKLSKLSYFPPVESQKDMLSKIQLYITDGDLLLSLVDPIKSHLNYKIALNILNGLTCYVDECEENNLECVLREDIDLKRKDVNSKLEEIDLINELIEHEANGNKNKEIDRDESIRQYMKCREICIKLEEYRIFHYSIINIIII